MNRPACKCMATKHEFVTNCTECGYIICEQDCSPELILSGASVPIKKQSNNPPQKNAQTKPVRMSPNKEIFCLFCRAHCLLPITADEALSNGLDDTTVTAYRMKDKLLQFDREHAQRTRVYDAQGDYYASAWLSDKEKEAILEKDRKRVERQYHSKKARKVTIRFDVAGNRIVEMTDEDEDLQEESVAFVEDNDYKAESMTAEMKGMTICRPFLDERDDVELEIAPYENLALELEDSRAAAAYRFMRQR